MKLKWNWGTKIFLAYGVFVAGMLFLVYLCTQQHFDLVRPDYYEAEIAFQNQLSSNENYLALADQPKVVEQPTSISVKVPNEMTIQSGEVYFYKPDNATMDKRFALQANGIEVAKDQLDHGMYTVKVSWAAGGKNYYTEEKIFIAKP